MAEKEIILCLWIFSINFFRMIWPKVFLLKLIDKPIFTIAVFVILIFGKISARLIYGPPSEIGMRNNAHVIFYLGIRMTRKTYKIRTARVKHAILQICIINAKTKNIIMAKKFYIVCTTWIFFLHIVLYSAISIGFLFVYVRCIMRYRNW